MRKLVLIAAMSLVGCLPIAPVSRDAVASTDAGLEARRLLDSGARLVDVRTKGEYESGHVEGAVNIPVSALAERLAELEPKTEGVVVYCRSGHRSAKAADILRKAGFTQVFDLGSVKNW
jgi:rhodanese-related sulfurtransferase